MPHVQSFPPVEDGAASILILGSMPGKESLRAGQYYAHPRNAFWPIMGDLIGAKPGLPYQTRTQMLKSAGIALWDVLASCKRHSSMDADIDAASICPNDFASFFLKHPNITHVFLTAAWLKDASVHVCCLCSNNARCTTSACHQPAPPMRPCHTSKS